MHGDLTAVNILLSIKGSEVIAKVADFGQITSKPGRNDIMPPEVRESQDPVELTKAVDVFSFGCLIPHVASCVYPEPCRDPLGWLMYVHGIYNIVKISLFHCICLLLLVLNSSIYYFLCTGVLYVDYIATSYAIILAVCISLQAKGPTIICVPTTSILNRSMSLKP